MEQAFTLDMLQSGQSALISELLGSGAMRTRLCDLGFTKMTLVTCLFPSAFGDPKAYRLPVPHVEGRYNVSFSGLKTAVLNLVNKAQMKGERVNVADMAASFQFRITDILAEKLLLAAQDTGAKQICIAGGVAANGLLRETLAAGAKKLGARLYLPELRLCGDNAAMVAAQGFYEYRAGNTAGLNLNGLATLGIDYL